MFSADKKRFVEECYPKSDNSRKWILSTLSLLSSYEEDWNMDFTMQDYEILQEAFNAVTAITFNGAKTILVRFKKYATWRKSVGLPCADSVFKLVSDRTVAMRDSMVSSPAQLAKALNIVFDDPVLGTIDVIYRVFLWMGYSGLSDIDAISVTDDEVDFVNMIIRHAGCVYPIYHESKYDFRIACDLRDFCEGRKFKARQEGNEIMRGKAGKNEQPRVNMLKGTIRPTLVRKFKKAESESQKSEEPIGVGLDLSFSKVFLSGIFYRLYLQERSGNEIDFSQYAIDEFNRAEQSDKPYKVSNKNPKAAILLRIKKSAESDYKTWKRAFHL